MIQKGTVSARGATGVEILIALFILALVSAVGVVVFSDSGDGARALATDVMVSDLNKAVHAKAAVGGRFQVGANALTVVTGLQAEVDAKSKRAGFGTHQKLDPEILLQPHTAEDGVARIAMTYDAQGLPVFAVTTTGPGYIATRLRGRTVAAEDWTAIVDSAGQVGARKSAWVYDYEAAGSIASAVAATGASPSPSGGGSTGSLTIEGPDTITAPGAYEWSALSSQPDKITITVPGAGSTTDDLTSRLVSPSLTLGSSSLDTNFVVTITASSATNTATKTVTVAIPGTPAVSFVSGPGITGVASISLLAGYPDWVATSSKPGSPLVIQLLKPSSASLAANIGAKEARVSGEKQVSLRVPTTLVPGMYGTLALTATVTTANGSADTSKNVQVDIPSAPRFTVTIK